MLNSRIINESRQQHFDLAIGHFHDLCPVAIAKQIGIKEILLVTHGTSLYDFISVESGIRTLPSVVPHPLSSFSDRMRFIDRVVNVFWSLSGIDFVNLPRNLLDDENSMYKKREFVLLDLVETVLRRAHTENEYKVSVKADTPPVFCLDSYQRT